MKLVPALGLPLKFIAISQRDKYRSIKEQYGAHWNETLYKKELGPEP
jgi:hypothetical protein